MIISSLNSSCGLFHLNYVLLYGICLKAFAIVDVTMETFSPSIIFEASNRVFINSNTPI
jgi:hypothetical protein